MFFFRSVHIMSQTIIGVFKTLDEAQQVVQDLVAQGIPQSSTRVSSQTGESATRNASSHSHGGFWEGLKDAFGFGDDNDDRYGYREAARRGNTIVSVTADD